MGVFDSDAALREAFHGAKSRKQILERLGVTAATSNYERLSRAAERLNVDLPPLGKHGKQRPPSGALADQARLRELVARDLTLVEILAAVGLAVTPANRHRLAGKLADMGLTAKPPARGVHNSAGNLTRLTGIALDRLTRAEKHTNATGDMAELAVAACLRRLGATVSFPFGYACRYDLIADFAGSLFRVQVKAGSVSRGCVTANTKSSNTNRPSRRYEQCDVDVIAVYCPALASVYWVPVTDLGGASILYLRLDEAANGQRANIKSAFDYYIGQV
ncbi:group I intron-associated PD-(D/E)XK endonuclease [Micromonospora sp. R77]|uniref:group I intron-associated PD-(D/E)XK endonuclease n=1 Tax=Micromonospora sp. R77 TaxID=2925836 RepID=UPI001F61DE84|nr:group I intron-associated PD-(D/E)XK endonuclease [Micromonospora sp. R77]MCI4064525.1 group I intron-associated PD-(D/E)XK endonuclease [Micromonospora sp. R77]